MRPSPLPHPPTDCAGRAIVWFRRDLRLDDNPAWAAAATTHREIVPLFVLDPRLVAAAGPFRCAFLASALADLDRALAARGGCLRVVTGDARDVVPREVRSLEASAVFANLDVSPLARVRDDAVEASLHRAGIGWHGWWGGLVHEPGSVRTAAGTLSQVFTAFYQKWQRTERRAWPTGEHASARVLELPADRPPAVTTTNDPSVLAHAHEIADDYLATRDLPAIDGTSRLSAALRFGTISPREVIDELGTHTPGRTALVRQLAWRDWYAHLTWDRPDIATHALRPTYDQIAWRDDPVAFRAWCDGRTGYPIVDAGMRQLAATGWMHNRVRMIAASFLVKDLLVDWRKGERWFRTLLVDGEVAQNAGNWQWVAGTGPDAAPYFRVFNPTTQGKKFDPTGAYIRRWVPELASLDAGTIHEPWLHGGLFGAPDYPAPLVDHRAARTRCLAAYAAAKA